MGLHDQIPRILRAREGRAVPLDRLHAGGIGMAVGIVLARAGHSDARVEQVEHLLVDRRGGPVMPELQDVDRAHCIGVRKLLVDLRVPGEQHAV